MSTDELIKVYESLKESSIDVEEFNWGPTYSFAVQRRKVALDILEHELRTLNLL